MVAYFLIEDTHKLKTLLFVLPEIKNYSKEKQAYVFAGILNDYTIDINKLKWFVLNNISNNDIALFKLTITILFDPPKKQLYYVGHIINLAANVFLYNQDPKDIKRQLTLDQSKIFRFILWRQYGVISKLHNFIFYIIHLPRQRVIFDK